MPCIAPYPAGSSISLPVFSRTTLPSSGILSSAWLPSPIMSTGHPKLSRTPPPPPRTGRFIRLARFGVDSPKNYKEDCVKGMRGYLGTPPRDLAGRNGGYMLPLMFRQSALVPSLPSYRLYTQTRPLISFHIYALYQKQAGLSKAQHGPRTIWHSIVRPPIRVLWFGGLSMRSSTMRHLQVVPRRYPLSVLPGRYPPLTGLHACTSPMRPRRESEHCLHSRATGGASSTSPGRSEATVPKRRHLSTVQFPGWLALQVPPMPICTRVHKVQAPTPRRRVWCWREEGSPEVPPSDISTAGVGVESVAGQHPTDTEPL